MLPITCVELLRLRIETPRKQHIPVPHAVGSFHDHTPRARRRACRNRIIRIVAGRDSEPVMMHMSLVTRAEPAKGKKKKKTHRGPDPPS